MAPNTNPLKFKRIGAGLSQSALASAAGISQQLMSKLENGLIKMTPERAQQFAQILGCSAMELLPALSVEPADQAQQIELLRILRDLNPTNKELLLRFAHTLLASELEEGAKKRANGS